MADNIPKALIDTLIAEAYGEGPEGMRRVAETIINRAAIRGLTLEQVVTQPSQYTGYSRPGPEAVKAQSNPKARAAAEAALRLAMQPGDPTNGADHYFAPGSISEPYWAKAMDPRGDYGGHRFYASRPIPPNEVPNVVASYMDTVAPITPPVPVTMSPDLSLMRNPRMSTTARNAQVTPGMTAGPGSPIADSIARTPIPGGRQTPPLFDAAYDTRTGAMRLIPAPTATSGVGFGATAAPRPPAPVPATQSPQLAATRARDQELQMELNRRYPPTRLPPLPPSTIGQPTTTRMTTAQVRQDNGQTRPATTRPSQDLVSTSFASVENARNRGLQAQLEERIAAASNTGIGRPPTTRVVPSVPVPQPFTPRTAMGPMDDVGSMGSWAHFQSQFGATPATRTAMAPPAPPNPLQGPAAGFVKPPEANERLMPGLPYPAGTAAMHGISTNAPFPRPASMRPGAVAPMPMPASMRPMVRAVPPPTRVAPIPAPLSMRPAMAPPRVSPLRVVVQATRPSVPLPMAQSVPAAPTQSVVQALRSQGLSPSQAYAMANAANYRPTVEDRVRGSSGGDAHAYSISG